MDDNRQEALEQRGLACRQCGGRKLKVIYTRAYRGGRLVRRRECR